MNDQKLNITVETAIRTAVLFVTMVNHLLSMSGKPLIPIEDVQLERLISSAAVIIAAIVAWWKNNSFSQPALKADQYLKNIRKDQ